MGWTLQRARRSGGAWYHQVVHRKKGVKGRTTLGLGYLSEDDAAMARDRVGRLPPPDQLVDLSWEQPGDEPPPTPEKRAALDAPPDKAILRWKALFLLTDTSERDADDVIEEWRLEHARQLMASRDFAAMNLREFVENVWWPYRKDDIAATNFRAEKSLWPPILEALGHLRLKSLNTIRWTAFLKTRATWSGRTRAVAQTGYRQCLKYAKQHDVIKAVHDFLPIKGATKPSPNLEPAEPFTLEEVERFLASCTTRMHAALFGYAIAQGLRPSEARRLHWEDINWDDLIVDIRGTKNDAAAAKVPLMPLAVLHLKVHWKKVGCPTSGHCFLWNGHPIKNSITAWKTAAKKAGINRRNFPYLARHTFATQAVVSRATQAAVRGMMRHSSRSTILERAYERLNTEQIREGMAPMCEATKADESGEDDGSGGSDG